MSADLGALIAPLQPFAQRLVDLGGRAGVQPRVTSTLRSRNQQQRLYAAYIRGETKYPVAPPGTSAHEFGWAFDMVADTAENLHDLGTVWRSWGGEWSADDEVHFQYPGFVRPAAEQTPVERNIVQRAADAYNALPWYVGVFGPTAATNQPITAQSAPLRSTAEILLCSLGFKSYC